MISIISEEEPPEYDVTERVKKLNEQLKSEPMPDEDKPHKIHFKQDLVDLVAPPPDYSDNEDTPRNEGSSPDKKTDKSAASSDKPKGKEDKVLMERGGKFELVNANEITADDFGLPVFDNDKENKDTSNYGAASHDNSNSNNNNNNFNRKPQPPSNPRPSTATGSSSSRRNIRQKPRARSATTRIDHESTLNNWDYNSPYALSKTEKEMLEQRLKHRDELQREEKSRKAKEDRKKREDNEDAFKAWLSQTRKRDQLKRQQEEDERQKNQRKDEV